MRGSRHTYILVEVEGPAIVDRYEADDDNPQPADSARRYFETNSAYRNDKAAYRVFVMLGNEPEWKP